MDRWPEPAFRLSRVNNRCDCMSPQRPYDLARITLVVLFIGVLIAGSLWTLFPFLGTFIWGATIVVATMVHNRSHSDVIVAVGGVIRNFCSGPFGGTPS